MIEGVKVKKLVVHRDIPDTPTPSSLRKNSGGRAFSAPADGESEDRPGFLMEVLRSDEGLMSKFGQSTFTMAYKGTIKAFHFHEKQDDLWFVAAGRIVAVLHDFRPDSATFGQTDVITAGDDDYKLIVIPAGVAHGYKVVSRKPVLLFYHTTEPYNSAVPDEKRIPWNDPKINFDWGKY